MKKAVFVLLLVLFFQLGVLRVGAVDVGLAPARVNVNDKESFSNFRFELNPGDRGGGELAVVNLATVSAQFKLEVEGEAGWLKLEEESVEVPAGERIRLSFEILVPEEAKPGEYVFEISSQGVKQEVVVLVRGEIKKQVSLEGVEVSINGGKVYLKGRINNVGQMRVESLGVSLHLKNKMWWELIKEREFFWPLEGELLPGESREFELGSENKLEFWGRFAAEAIVSYDESQTSEGLREISYLDWQQLLVYSVFVLLSLVVLVWFVWKFLRLVFKIVVFIVFGLRFGKKKKSASTKSGLESDELLSEIRRIIREEIELSRGEKG